MNFDKFTKDIPALVILPDGRPLDESERLELLAEIEEHGVLGSHLDRLKPIFAATSEEVLVALGVGATTFAKLRKDDGPISEVPVAMLVKLYLNEPTAWPIRYTTPIDIDSLIDNCQIAKELRISLSMAVGRSNAQYFKWRENTAGNKAGMKGSIRVLLRYIEQASTDKQRAGMKKIILSEAKLRGVNLQKDKSW